MNPSTRTSIEEPSLAQIKTAIFIFHPLVASEVWRWNTIRFLEARSPFRDSTLMPVCSANLPSEKNQSESRGVHTKRSYCTRQGEGIRPGNSLCSSNTRSRSPLLDVCTLGELQAIPIKSEREREINSSINAETLRWTRLTQESRMSLFLHHPYTISA